MEWNISFISEENYKKHVNEFFQEVLKCSTASSLSEFNKNIVDPVKLTFSYFATGENKIDVVNAEITRQQDKTINNSIGYFHQKMFQYIEGWTVPASGFDVESHKKHIFVELKNKHNTMNSSSAQRTYINMQHKILNDDQATCMLVEVIAKRSQDKPWVISLDGQRKSHMKIRRVSIDKFYEIVTGDPEAFKKLIEWLPITLKLLVVEKQLQDADNTIISQLEQNGTFFEGLYQLAFNAYQGFNNLKFVGEDKIHRCC